MTRRRLSQEEKALWKRVVSDVRPIVPSQDAEEPAPAPTAAAATPATPRARAPAPPKQAPPRPARLPAKPKPPPSPFVAGDPAAEKKARRGRLRPERTLDLHGLTQARARPLLERFIAGARADGLRCVLVITGKGKPSADGAAPGERSPRGVLRARFAEWVSEPPLREGVVRVAEAAQADGGAGAFYVFLKRDAARSGA